LDEKDVLRAANEAEISRTIGAVDIFALEQAAEAILEAVRQMRIALETS
jgi:hypothetical protein